MSSQSFDRNSREPYSKLCTKPFDVKASSALSKQNVLLLVSLLGRILTHYVLELDFFFQAKEIALTKTLGLAELYIYIYIYI